MKKSLLLLLTIGMLFILNACSDDDKESPDKDKTETIINPPKWLHGTWKSTELRDTHKFEFTPENFIFTQLNITYDFAKIAKEDIYTVKEITNTDAEYRIDKITDLVGTGQTATDSFKFIKVSDNEVTFYMSGVGVTPVPITLKRVL